jgi:hypothetical protein
MRFQWTERTEIVKKYPPFTLNVKEYPELELELQDIYRATTTQEQERALQDLEHKMHTTQVGERGETIFDMVGPFNESADENIIVCPADEFVVSLTVTPNEEN